MTATPSPVAAAAPALEQGRLLRLALDRLAMLRRKARIGIGMEAAALTGVALLAFALATYVLDRNLRLEVPFRAVLLLGFAVVVARLLLRRLLTPLRVVLDDDEMALAVERQAPALQQALISSMQFERTLLHGRAIESVDLMRAVIADVHGRFATVPFMHALDARRFGRFVGVLGVVAALFSGWGIVDPASLRLWAMRNLALSTVEWPRYTQLAFAGADGAKLRLPQGDPLTVRVAVTGRTPEQVFLHSRFASGESDVEPMSRTGDGEYTLTIETLIEPAELYAEGGDGRSAPLRVEIVERPRIEQVVFELTFPDYMHKEPELVPPTEGEVRVLRGSRLRIGARSHKSIDEAFLVFGEQKLPLERDQDGHAFRGELAPDRAGLLVVDVIDTDKLGAAAPPRLLLRLVEDQPPSLDFKLRGISSLVTPQVRIPGDLKVKDDFGIAAVAAGYRVVDDAAEHQTPRAPGDAPPPEPPLQPIDVATTAVLEQGSVRYETAAIVDFKPLNRAPKDDDPSNPLRPGLLLTLRFSAKDNFGPGAPHEAFGEPMSFRIVTRDKLVDELRRRQQEQRQEVERIRDDEVDAQVLLGEQNPAQNEARAAQLRAHFKALAARQQSLGRRVAFVADLYQRILWEYENNRIWEPSKVREYEGLTAVPLANLAKEAFPDTAHAVATFADTGDEELRASAVEGYKDIIVRLEAIRKVMEQVETLAALIEQVRGVIKVEDRAIQETEKQLKAAGENVFGRKPTEGSKPK